MSKSIVILKTGSTFPDLARRYGDFEHWVAAGLGLPADRATVVDPQGADRLPEPQSIEAVVVTGSHDMVTESLRGIEATSDWLRRLVERRVPTLGICYGHQLLAHALGGRVGYHPGGLDVGTVTIRCLPAWVDDPLFGTMPPSFPAYVSHAQSVLELPPGAVRLAESDFEPNQAFRAAGCAWGVQFHPEFSEPAIRYYIAKQRECLAGQGLDVDLLIEAVRPSPADRLLQQFGRLSTSPRP